MSPQRRLTDSRSLPTELLEGEIWDQCQLRLTLQFQAQHGISLVTCHPDRRDSSVSRNEILDHPVGMAIHDAMLSLVIDEEFQDALREHLAELEHLDPDIALKLAFNLAIDRAWARIEHCAIACSEPGL
jgi:hypothetical protein